MTLNIQIPESSDLRPKIIVFGVGGAGCNAVNNMIEKELEGVDFLVANTDAQALRQSQAKKAIQLGEKLTQGLGAGACPMQGEKAAEENIDTIIDHLQGAHMCFITAGMGGGTGTGAAPVIARVARELDILTVGVVTKPFQFEGAKRMRQAEAGIEALQKVVHTLIIIPNQNLFSIATEKTTFSQAFSMADEVLHQGVKGVTDLMVRTGLINLDFADIRIVMNEMGKAMMGTGEAEGEARAVTAAEQAISNPLLDQISLNTAKGVLINISGGDDLTLFEVDESANLIRDKVDSDANIIVGSIKDETLNGKMRVSVVATGIDAMEGLSERDILPRVQKTPLKLMEDDFTQSADGGRESAGDMPRDAVASNESPARDEVVAETPAGMPPGMPDPAYRPEVAQSQNPEPSEQTEQVAQNFFDDTHHTAAHETSNDTPQGANISTPTPSVDPDVRARLIAAVLKQPETPAPRADATRGEAGDARDERADIRAESRTAPEPAPRAGILTSLFGRKKSAEATTKSEPAASQSSVQPTAESAPQSTPQASVQPLEPIAPKVGGRGDAAYMDSQQEQERIEIPAFLRRQAN